MDSIVFYPSSVIRLAYFSTLSIRKLETPFFALKEIADGPSLLASRRGHGQVTTLSIRVDGNRSGRPSLRTSASGRFRKSDGEKIPQSSYRNSSNQEEIISLFRRIQSSISKGESISSKKRHSKSSEEKPSAESVLEVLRQSRKQVKAKTLNERGEKVLAIRRGQLKNEDKTDYPSVPDLKFTRPPSNFVKRSPIPSATSSRVKSEGKGEESSVTGGEKALELEQVEEMKLSALKELAKSRGLKGYSKLKKSELIELLRP